MQNTPIHIGLAGFGTVGTGLAQILLHNTEWIGKRLGRDLHIKTVLVRDVHKRRSFIPSPDTCFVDRLDALVDDPDLDIVVELIGGLNTAFEIISRSLDSGKSVVTANKHLLAEKGPELFSLAARRQAGLYYEASVGGGIPIVQTLKESLAGNRIKSLMAILNGTSNYMLTEMSRKQLEYTQALEKAREKGYAEADPALDVEGWDAAHKLCVLIRLAYGRDYPLSALPVQGIDTVNVYDILKAQQFGYVLKLIAQVREQSGCLQAGVFPALVSQDHMLSKVDGPFNAIVLEGNAVGPIMLYGQGAGDLPTGSAVLADIMALVNQQAALNNTGFLENDLQPANILQPEFTVSKHFLRITVQDRPGVLAVLARIMGDQNISIAQLIQTQEAAGQFVPIVLLTHAAQLQQIQNALQDIDSLEFVQSPTVHYRIL